MNSAELLTAPAQAACTAPDGSAEPVSRCLAREHRLTLCVDGAAFGPLVSTCDRLRELVLGRLCTAGRIAEESDVRSLRFSEEEGRAEVTLRPGAGGDSVSALTDHSGWRGEDIFRLAKHLRENMPLHDATSGTHGAALLHRGKVLCCCEDIGRHNAIDKAVGAALALGVPLSECVLYTTGRIAVDIVRKTAAAGVPVLVSRALPTAEALALAKSLRLTLIGRAREAQYELFTP